MPQMLILFLFTFAKTCPEKYKSETKENEEPNEGVVRAEISTINLGTKP